MKIKIGKFEISKSSKVFIVAELSANHNQDIEIAKETIRAAKRSGADAIKLQTYTPDTITIDSKKEKQYKNHWNFSTENIMFFVGKRLQNETKISPEIDEKTMRKSMQKITSVKNRNDRKNPSARTSICGFPNEKTCFYKIKQTGKLSKKHAKIPQKYFPKS